MTWLMRRHVPFPTYTTPFILTTWAVYFLGLALGAAEVEASWWAVHGGFLAAVAHGVSQVMFQASVWTALLFLIGIAISDWQHASGSSWDRSSACWSGSTTRLARGPSTPRASSIAPDRELALGLYGYNATLAAVALFLWRRSLISPLLGILLSVPLTELVPMLGLPALTAPFVLATWLVLALGWLEGKLFRSRRPALREDCRANGDIDSPLEIARHRGVLPCICHRKNATSC